MSQNDDRPALVDSDRAAEQITGGGSASAMLPQGGDERPLELGPGDASVIPPSAGRTMTRAVTRCAECGAVTVHPFRDGGAVNGAIRRGACRHLYRLRVRRVLAQWARDAA